MSILGNSIFSTMWWSRWLVTILVILIYQITLDKFLLSNLHKLSVLADIQVSDSIGGIQHSGSNSHYHNNHQYNQHHHYPYQYVNQEDDEKNEYIESNEQQQQQQQHQPQQNQQFYTNNFHTSQNLKISPKPCTVGQFDGTCMFVWECIRSEGHHVGMCVDSFMFGSCCSHNITENVVMPQAFSYTRPTKPITGIRPRPPHLPHKPSSISGLTTIERPHGAGTLVIRPSGLSHQRPNAQLTSSATASFLGGIHQKPIFTNSNNNNNNNNNYNNNYNNYNDNHNVVISTTIKYPSLTNSIDDLETAASVGGGNIWNTSPQTTQWHMTTEPNFITKPRPPLWEKPSSLRPKPAKPTKKPILFDRPYETSAFGGYDITKKPPNTTKPKPQIFYPKPTKSSSTTSKLPPSTLSFSTSYRPPATYHHSGSSIKPAPSTIVHWSTLTSTPLTTTTTSTTTTTTAIPIKTTTKAPRTTTTTTTQAPKTTFFPTKLYTTTTTTTSTTTTTTTTEQPSTNNSSDINNSIASNLIDEKPLKPIQNPDTSFKSTTTTTTTNPNIETNEISDPSKPPLIPTLSAARTDCGIPSLFTRPETRIVGGKNAPFGRWPWQVSVRRTSFFGFSSTHRCGGALINENWIATAGHCVDDLLTSQIRIRVGEYDFSHVQEQLPYIERGVATKVVHPKYNFFTYEYDLALVKLEQSLEFAPHVSPICLPATNDLLIGQNATVTGWGRLSEGGTLPSVLQEVSVPIVSNDRCKMMFARAGRQEFIPDIFLCAGYDTGGQDSCQGDSGGPLQVKGQDGKYFLAGIISWGIGCAEANLPGVCTRISKFVPWILDVVK